MMETKSTKTTEEQLLAARENSLNSAQQLNAMNAHGKVLEMDTFSWINPDLDSLAEVIRSFPFKVIWVGSHEQIKHCLEDDEMLVNNLETIIVHDKPLLNVSRKLIHRVVNIACIEGAGSALQLMIAMKKDKHVLLFTASGPDTHLYKNEFDSFIETNR